MTAYAIFIRESTTDAANLETYAQKASAAGEGHAITRLALYGQLDILEGADIEGCVILSFPTMAKARRWYDSPAYQEALQYRLEGGEYRAFIVEGVDAAG